MGCGLPLVEVHHTVTVCDGNPFTELEHLVFRLPVAGGAQQWQIPLLDAEPLQLGPSSGIVHQAFDDQYGHAPPYADKGRVVGAAIMPHEGGVAVAVRDFWQNYPKAFAVTNEGLDVGLFPPFEAGPYDKFPFEKEGHHLYYYLRDGHYRLRSGVSKTHEMLLSFEPQADVRRDQCLLFQRSAQWPRRHPPGTATAASSMMWLLATQRPFHSTKLPSIRTSPGTVTAASNNVTTAC